MHPTNYIDLTGQVFGKWTVIKRAPNGNKGQTRWECQCECGTVKPVQSAHLRTGRSTNCGCESRRKTAERNRILKRKHGCAIHGNRARLYNIHRGMKCRCYVETDPAYHLYGGRGIKICDEWMGEHGFEHFRDWSLENGYSDDLTIDRIDFDGDYSPDNCRWATMKQQANNKRNNRYITIDGETKTASEWAEENELPQNTVTRRLCNGMNEIDAVTLPIDTSKWSKKFEKPEQI